MLKELHPCFMDADGMTIRTVQDQVEVMQEHIDSLIKQRERLLNAVYAPDAAIIYTFECNYPTAVYVGNQVGTKYGDSGKVVAVDKINGSLTIKKEDGTEEEFEGCRISYCSEEE